MHGWIFDSTTLTLSRVYILAGETESLKSRADEFDFTASHYGT